MRGSAIPWLCGVMMGGVIFLSVQTSPPSTNKSDAVFKQLTSLDGAWEQSRTGTVPARTDVDSRDGGKPWQLREEMFVRRTGRVGNSRPETPGPRKMSRGGGRLRCSRYRFDTVRSWPANGVQGRRASLSSQE